MQINRRHRQIEVVAQLIAPEAPDETMQDIALTKRKHYFFLRRVKKILHSIGAFGSRNNQHLTPAIGSWQEADAA